jgi:UPF0176 protein
MMPWGDTVLTNLYLYSQMRGKTLHNKVNRDELRARIQKDEIKRTTLSFYAYAHIPDPDAFRDSFYKALQDLEVFGRIYIAHEGVNAQLSVPSRRLDELRTYLDTIPFLNNIRLNIAVEDNGKSFFALAIKVREKIVADGLTDPDFDVRNSGIHLDAESFNQLTEDPETIKVR